MSTRFEFRETIERDGVVFVIITAYTTVKGSETRLKVGGGTRYLESFDNRHWRYKDGKLESKNDSLEWAEPTERTEESEYVLACLTSSGYVPSDLNPPKPLE